MKDGGGGDYKKLAETVRIIHIAIKKKCLIAEVFLNKREFEFFCECSSDHS